MIFLGLIFLSSWIKFYALESRKSFTDVGWVVVVVVDALMSILVAFRSKLLMLIYIIHSPHVPFFFSF